MKLNWKIFSWCFVFVFASTTVMAQIPSPVTTEAGDTEAEESPLDDIVERTSIKEMRILNYDPIREIDVMWEKRIWRVIDANEKMNLPFVYTDMPFIKILMDGAENSDIKVYSDEKFKGLLSPAEVMSIGSNVDTVYVMDPETYEEKLEIVRDDLNPEDIKRFRVKEVWYFDRESSTMKVRILGIAPLRDVKDEQGNFRYEQPMFWVYYPDAREYLARHEAFNPWNDAGRMSWEDMLEMRFFSSYIYKQSNAKGDRLQDIYSPGEELLQEADKIKNEIFNFEQDLWSY